jgi:NADPH:quinone reductase
MKALTFSSFGGPEVLQYNDIPAPIPGPGELLVQMKAIGLNYADIYRRKGNYTIVPQEKYIAGYEGTGIVIDAGNATGFATGDAICFADVPLANAELVRVPVTHAIPLPKDISFITAASVLLQGLTVHYLVTDSYAVKENDIVLVHACAGGVGQIMVQAVKSKKAIAIGLTSSEEKRDKALANGADEVFLYSNNWVEEIQTFTVNKGVDVVYESVGSTLLQSFEALKKTGTMVFFGMAGGDPPLIDPRMLMDTSKTLVGGDLWCYLTSKEERLKRSGELFEWVSSGKINIPEPTLFKLSEGRQAHELLESRKSTGKIVLIP